MYQDYGFQTSIPSHTHAYLFEPIKDLLNKEKNTSILDVGCGNGWLANALLHEGFNVYGIDASPSGIAIAKQSHPERFHVQDISSDYLPDAIKEIPFDTIISTEVIEHLYSPRQYLDFCYRVLEPQGGELILSTPYHGYLKNLVLAVTGKMDDHFTALWEGGDIKFWSKKTLEEGLRKSAFDPVDFVGCGRLPYLWKSMVVKAQVN